LNARGTIMVTTAVLALIIEVRRLSVTGGCLHCNLTALFECSLICVVYCSCWPNP
jgi:hypothetical protein